MGLKILALLLFNLKVWQEVLHLLQLVEQVSYTSLVGLFGSEELQNLVDVFAAEHHPKDNLEGKKIKDALSESIAQTKIGHHVVKASVNVIHVSDQPPAHLFLPACFCHYFPMRMRELC